jgi:hypothetical protein
MSRKASSGVDVAGTLTGETKDFVFKGLIRRQHLTTLLKYRDLCKQRPDPYRRYPAAHEGVYATIDT